MTLNTCPLCITAAAGTELARACLKGMSLQVLAFPFIATQEGKQ